jgi:polar amino acid transport system substrate-binding protein
MPKVVGHTSGGDGAQGAKGARRRSGPWGLPALLTLVACACLPPAPRTVAAEPALTVAIQTDLPPYVLHDATAGIEVQIVRQALEGRSPEFVQMPYAQLQTAVPRKRADVAVAVKHLTDDGVSYSGEFITFSNAAISKKAAGLTIDDVGGLKGHEVLAWQDAYLELGPVFAQLYAPKGPRRGNYSEFGDQREQVRAFWAAADDVIVIDRAVFRYFSEAMGHPMEQVVFHAIFPAVTNFRVAFADATLRDAFDRGLAKLCQTGAYAKILATYEVDLPRTVCDR